MISTRSEDRLRERMSRLGIREQDLSEQFVRSGGAGGQNVNKVNTCVFLRHAPSGIEVKCMISRSQAENRHHARRILCDRLEEKILGRESAAARERHRIRQQKRKRSRRAKEKLRRLKEHRSEKKSLRRAPEF